MLRILYYLNRPVATGPVGPVPTGPLFRAPTILSKRTFARAESTSALPLAATHAHIYQPPTQRPRLGPTHFIAMTK